MLILSNIDLLYFCIQNCWESEFAWLMHHSFVFSEKETKSQEVVIVEDNKSVSCRYVFYCTFFMNWYTMRIFCFPSEQTTSVRFFLRHLVFWFIDQIQRESTYFEGSLFSGYWFLVGETSGLNRDGENLLCYFVVGNPSGH